MMKQNSQHLKRDTRCCRVPSRRNYFWQGIGDQESDQPDVTGKRLRKKIPKQLPGLGVEEEITGSALNAQELEVWEKPYEQSWILRLSWR